MDPVATTVPGLSFATDLLFNLDAVRKACGSGLSTHQGLLSLLKGRVQLELHYAAELTRLADQFKVDQDMADLHPSSYVSSLNAALLSVKSQYVNASVQHKSLAASLDEDVYRPLNALYQSLAKKEQSTTSCMARVRKQAKALEENFRKQHAKMDKTFKEATMTYAQALEAGIAPRVIQEQVGNESSSSNNALEDSTSFLGELFPKRRPTTTIASRNASIDSVKLVSWLLPNEHQKKESLAVAAARAVESAEAARFECRQAYAGFEDARVALYRSTQSILNDYQTISEQRSTQLSTSLRKHIVFESATLANLQYDWQMVAKPLEAVDVDADLRAFILHNYRPIVPHMTIADLCTTETPLPHPPRTKAFGLHDVTLRRYPLDTCGNRQSVYGWLVTRDQSIYANDAKPAVVPVVSSHAVAKAVQAALACIIASVSKPEDTAVPDDKRDDDDRESSESTHSTEC
ncbi:hypothetical protein SDRG_12609 [Saprolegnia diclina VS20]|uniref:F-BAR domain-containing protein n=1 Tax=Saprolegnia diclina (strain VS20) TaxID=1156394 RepID=T0RID7_SAPDV|nr:hypothetical protein SDRG_12609 [Saprolegnia diclina VS20]EQC29602.1 hypothetical protein SDRG_12609 [Saprolegnia diclina VS20]|eukprot:XP_008616906.1 hypothetical protein SDRG_12609 [Saprolegnia diclina VS20]